MEGIRSMKFLRFASRLRQDVSGIALTEFAISFPIMLALGMYGIDTANLALTHLRVNQIALNLADNASRVGANNSAGVQEMREIDVIDVLQAAIDQGAPLDLATNGRIVLSSLEKNASGTQRIHWQRCIGSMTGATFESHYGQVKNVDGSPEVDANRNGTIEESEKQYQGATATNGMGESGFKVNAPINSSGVMFVEVNYRFTPMFGWISSQSDIRQVASFIVRDSRNFDNIFNPNSATPSYCGYANRVSPT